MCSDTHEVERIVRGVSFGTLRALVATFLSADQKFTKSKSLK